MASTWPAQALACRGWRQMDDDLSQTGNALQTVALIEVGKNGSGAIVTPESEVLPVANQGKDKVMTK